MQRDPASRLKLSHFRLIAAVAEHGQMSPAAAALSMTQPAASRMLREIERLVGAPLFERHARGMSPTEVGRLLSRHADTLLTEVRAAIVEVEEFKQGKGGRVRVGAVTGAAVGYVMPAIQKLKATSPNADVHIDVAPSDALIRDLMAGHFDFVLGRVPPPFDPRDFMISSGRSEIVDLVVRRDHPRAGANAMSIIDLGGYEWILQSVGAPVRVAVERAFIDAGGSIPPNIIHTTSLLAMIALLVTSDAIAPLSREVSDLLGGNGGGLGLAILPIREALVVDPYHLLSLRSRPLSPLALRLKGLVVQELARGTSP
ncbi:LysR family transcriptional regulator [Chelativorans sp. AA-79]|uniref:LysR family transcriptional regulator n=1 Tax=Chelativorans sp. AA-79 TaxID=3028735 RepID=UPI0023F88D84|nr:LysR family transcriptional regulator [Chelativorans sp. AA-79]WEX07789.1 LysR family transcriptional regulator [Chelativorans sp. AA-79]